MNNIAPKLQKCWTHKIAFNITSKILKQPNFFYGKPSHFKRKHLQSFTFLRQFGISFMTSSVVPTRSSIFYAYLITNIGNRNLNNSLLENNNFLSKMEDKINQIVSEFPEFDDPRINWEYSKFMMREVARNRSTELAKERRKKRN